MLLPTELYFSLSIFIESLAIVYGEAEAVDDNNSLLRDVLELLHILSIELGFCMT